MSVNPCNPQLYKVECRGWLSPTFESRRPLPPIRSPTITGEQTAAPLLQSGARRLSAPVRTLSPGRHVLGPRYACSTRSGNNQSW